MTDEGPAQTARAQQFARGLEGCSCAGWTKSVNREMRVIDITGRIMQTGWTDVREDSAVQKYA